VARNLIWAGFGARGRDLTKYGLPVVLTWGGADLLPTDHPLNIGIVGVSGQPGANKAVHEADEITVIGSGIHLTQTAGAKLPMHELSEGLIETENHWGDLSVYKKLNEMPDVGSYKFNKKMTRMLPPGVCMVIDGGGTALYTGFQSSHVKEGSRLICSTAISAMGSGLPEALGACVANGKSLTTCLIGDGSLMFNLGTLETIKNLKLPIKIFVLNNGGYLAIRHTQDGFLGGRHHGTESPDISITPINRLAYAFDIPFIRLEDPYDEEKIGIVLDSSGPVLCEVITPKDQKMVRQGFKEEGGKYIAQPLSEMVY